MLVYSTQSQSSLIIFIALLKVTVACFTQVCVHVALASLLPTVPKLWIWRIDMWVANQCTFSTCRSSAGWPTRPRCRCVRNATRPTSDHSAVTRRYHRFAYTTHSQLNIQDAHIASALVYIVISSVVVAGCRECPISTYLTVRVHAMSSQLVGLASIVK